MNQTTSINLQKSKLVKASVPSRKEPWFVRGLSNKDIVRALDAIDELGNKTPDSATVAVPIFNAKQGRRKAFAGKIAIVPKKQLHKLRQQLLSDNKRLESKKQTINVPVITVNNGEYLDYLTEKQCLRELLVVPAFSKDDFMTIAEQFPTNKVSQEHNRLMNAKADGEINSPEQKTASTISQLSLVDQNHSLSKDWAERGLDINKILKDQSLNSEELTSVPLETLTNILSPIHPKITNKESNKIITSEKIHQLKETLGDNFNDFINWSLSIMSLEDSLKEQQEFLNWDSSDSGIYILEKLSIWGTRKLNNPETIIKAFNERNSDPNISPEEKQQNLKIIKSINYYNLFIPELAKLPSKASNEETHDIVIITNQDAALYADWQKKGLNNNEILSSLDLSAFIFPSTNPETAEALRLFSIENKEEYSITPMTDLLRPFSPEKIEEDYSLLDISMKNPENSESFKYYANSIISLESSLYLLNAGLQLEDEAKITLAEESLKRNLLIRQKMPNPQKIIEDLEENETNKKLTEFIKYYDILIPKLKSIYIPDEEKAYIEIFGDPREQAIIMNK